MPEILYRADQGPGVRSIIRIMQGDKRTHIVRFVVPRYDDGVDLADLVWYIRFVDTDGNPDIALPNALYEVTDADIRVRWTIDSVLTTNVGRAQFQLCGVGADSQEDEAVWSSGFGVLEITKGLNVEIPEEMHEPLQAVNELIVRVQTEVPGVISAGEAAQAAAEIARTNASKANSAASAANSAASTATSAAGKATSAAGKATSAAGKADSAIQQFKSGVVSPVESVCMQRMLERADMAIVPKVALRDMPDCGGKTTVEGTDVTGITYSSVYRIGRLVGCHVLPATYYSALENPASKMYTEREFGTQGDKSTYYGITCSGFVSYAVGLDIYNTTVDLAKRYIGNVVPIESVDDVFDVRRGDILLNTIRKTGGGYEAYSGSNNHCKLVRDIVYEPYTGRLKHIVVQEAWKPFVKVTNYTPEKFYEQMEEVQPYFLVRTPADDFSKIVRPHEYSRSVYPDKGDKAVYDPSEEVWLYLPDNQVEYIYVSYNDGYPIEHHKGALDTKVVNGVTVWRVPIAVNPGTFAIYTDLAPDDPAEITMFYKGQVNVLDDYVSAQADFLDTYLTPHHVETIYLTPSASEPLAGAYAAPKGYIADHSTASRMMINTQGFYYNAQSYASGRDGYYVRVWFSDKNGSLVYMDSDFIFTK